MDEQWVKDLHYHKLHLTERDKYKIAEILEDNEISAEILLKRIDSLSVTNSLLNEVRAKLETEFVKYEAFLKEEKE